MVWCVIVCDQNHSWKICLANLSVLSNIFPEVELNQNFAFNLGFSPCINLNFRESQCAVLLLLGFTSKESAKRIGISPRTVEYYLSSIKRRCGAKTRSEVFAALLQSNLISDVISMIN